MKQLAWAVQGLVIVMLMLNGLLLVMSRGEIWPAVLLLILPLPLWYFVDRRRWYELPGWATNLVGFGIGFYAIYYFLNQASERHLAIVSDLVCYLIVTLLMQAKSPRLYWQIAILSVLQSVVASVFSLNLQQGMIFLLYIFVVLTTLSIIVLNRDQLMAACRLDRFHNLVARPRPGMADRGGAHRGGMRLVPTSSQWQMGNLRPLLVAISGLAVGCVATGMAVYVSLPRDNQGEGVGTLRLSTIGISRRIESLEPRGVLLPNSNETLRIKIVDPTNDKAVRLNGDIYLRGTCLEVLNSQATGWRASTDSSRPAPQNLLPTMPGKVYRQEFVLNPREDPMLFACLPASAAIRTNRDILFEVGSETLFRFSAAGIVAGTPFRYELGLAGIQDGNVSEYSPFLNHQFRSYDRPLNEDAPARYERLVAIDPAKYPRLVAKAKEIEARVPNGWRDRQAVARALTGYLANSSEFTYTTDFRSIQRDPSLDPVEDFVANYRQGHCELYASALCLMLRAVDIPSRVVVGYRASKYNEVARMYQVQEKHAHSWVEAYLAPRHCSDEMRRRGWAGDGGAWLRLDPTPPGSLWDDDDFSLIGQANDAFGYAQSLWDDYILGIQSESPDAGESIFARWNRLQALLDPTQAAEMARAAFLQLSTLQRVLLAGLIVASLAWLQWGSNRLNKRRARNAGKRRRLAGWRRWLDWTGLTTFSDRAFQHWADPFWQQLETAANKLGYPQRKASVTPLEYVQQLMEHAQPGPATVDHQNGSQPLPRLQSQLNRFVENFYDLKFRPSSVGDSDGTATARPAVPNGDRRQQLADLQAQIDDVRNTLRQLQPRRATQGSGS